MIQKTRNQLEISPRMKFGKFANMWKLNNTFLNDQCIKRKKEITKEIEQKLELRYADPRELQRVGFVWSIICKIPFLGDTLLWEPCWQGSQSTGHAEVGFIPAPPRPQFKT